MKALAAWRAAAGRTGDPVEAARAAAEAVADDPWTVVREAGALARAAIGVEGEPVLHPGRAGRGAWDTPRALAHRVVAAAGTSGRVLDPACGTGALLLAAHEAGARDLWGTDVDPAALAVAAVAVPSARLELADALAPGEPVDRVVVNPPFVAAELQSRADRAALRMRWPWLAGRFDLAVAVLAAAGERVLPGGGLGAIAPAGVLTERYGLPLRRRWLARDRVTTLGPIERFPGVAARFAVLGIHVGGPPGPLPSGVSPSALAGLRGAPLDAAIGPGDPELLGRIAQRSVSLREIATIDTGVVVHGGGHTKAARLFDHPGPGRVPYADAKDFFRGHRRWLAYERAAMHRAKSPALFEVPKVVVQRIRHGGVRAAVDRDGVYVGHTCTVVVPHALPPESIAALLADPLVAGVLRIANGARLDLYPHDLGAIPVPVGWSGGDLASAWGLDASEAARLRSLAGTAPLAAEHPLQ